MITSALSARRIGRTNFVFLGNSQTVGYLASLPYPTQLSPSLPTPNASTNSGVNAQTTQDMINGIAAQAYAFFDRAARNVAVIWTGTNDKVVLGDTASQSLTRCASYYGLLKAFGFHVAAIDMEPRSGSGVPSDFEDFRATWNSGYNVSPGTYFDSLYRVSQNSLLGPNGAETNALYYIDGTHNTDLGYSIIASEIVSAIYAVL